MTLYQRELLLKTVDFYKSQIVRAAEKGGMAHKDYCELLDGLYALKGWIPDSDYDDIEFSLAHMHILDPMDSKAVKADIAVDAPTMAYTIKDGLKRLVRALKGAVAYALLWAVIILVSYLVCAHIDAQARDTRGTYPTVLVVDSVDYETHTVVYRTSQGFTYTVVQDDMDVSVGETYAATMDDMGTKQISDDTIVNRRYIRMDMINR